MQNNQKRADLILETAVQKFSQFGYEGVSTTDLAKASNVSQPSIHYHYGTKLNLWKAAVDEIIERVRVWSSLEGDLAAAEGTMHALEIYIRSLCAASMKFPEMGRLITNEGQIGGERLEYLISSFVGEGYDAFVSIIQEGIDAGKIKRYRPEQILFLMHGGLVNYFVLSPLVQASFGHSSLHRKNADAFLDMYLDVVLDGISAK